MTSPTETQTPSPNGQSPQPQGHVPADLAEKRRKVVAARKQEAEVPDLPQVEALQVLGALNQDIEALLEGVTVARKAGVLGGKLVGVPCPLYPPDEESGYPGLRVWYRTSNRYDVARVWLATADAASKADPALEGEAQDAEFFKVWPLFIARFEPPLETDRGEIANVGSIEHARLITEQDGELAIWLTNTGYETAKAASSKNL